MLISGPHIISFSQHSLEVESSCSLHCAENQGKVTCPRPTSRAGTSTQICLTSGPLLCTAATQTIAPVSQQAWMRFVVHEVVCSFSTFSQLLELRILLSNVYSILPSFQEFLSLSEMRAHYSNTKSRSGGRQVQKGLFKPQACPWGGQFLLEVRFLSGPTPCLPAATRTRKPGHCPAGVSGVPGHRPEPDTATEQTKSKGRFQRDSLKATKPSAAWRQFPIGTEGLALRSHSTLPPVWLEPKGCSGAGGEGGSQVGREPSLSPSQGRHPTSTCDWGRQNLLFLMVIILL